MAGGFEIDEIGDSKKTWDDNFSNTQNHMNTILKVSFALTLQQRSFHSNPIQYSQLKIDK